MCRHLAYLGPPVTIERLLLAPPHGLYTQSWAPRRQKHGTVNVDGFGFGWYPPAETGGHSADGLGADGLGADGHSTDGNATDVHSGPARYRRAVPIWTDANLPDLARTVRSGAVIAAVRSATAGTSQDEAACAPFREGRFLFSQNGAVQDWRKLPAELAAQRGDLPGEHVLAPCDLLSLDSLSDSALLWAMLTRALQHRPDSPDAALAELVRTVAALRPDARLNFLLTDGRTVYATRYHDTLWYRSDSRGTRVLIASEPDDAPALPADTTPDTTTMEVSPTAWHEVPDESLLSAGPAGIHITPLCARTSSGEEVSVP